MPYYKMKFVPFKEKEDLDLGRFSEKIYKPFLISNSDGTYDYNGDLNFSNMDLKSLKEIPIRLRNVSGDFNCYENQLTNLEGAPLKVGGHFRCYKNQLTNLEGSPLEVGGFFVCLKNKLISLQYAPLEVGRSFYCYKNNLLSNFHLADVKHKFDSYPNSFIITEKAIEAVKQMTHEQQMSELKFFDEHDSEASKKFQSILDTLGICVQFDQTEKK